MVGQAFVLPTAVSTKSNQLVVKVSVKEKGRRRGRHEGKIEGGEDSLVKILGQPPGQRKPQVNPFPGYGVPSPALRCYRPGFLEIEPRGGLS